MKRTLILTLGVPTLALFVGVATQPAVARFHNPDLTTPSGKAVVPPVVAPDPAIARADDLFLQGDTKGALTRYEGLAKGVADHAKVPLLLKIATGHAVAGRYEDAMRAYREAETVGQMLGDPAVTTGRVKALMAYLAHSEGRRDDLAKIVGAVPPDGESFADGPAAPPPGDAWVYVRFGRVLSKARHLEGTRFAYESALRASGRDPAVSYEYARTLSAIFHETAEEIRVLREARVPEDPKLRRSMERTLHHAESYQAVYLENLRKQGATTRRDPHRNDDAFRALGVTDAKSSPRAPKVP